MIAGAGKVGFALASLLSSEGHDITVIDDREDRINNASNTLDVISMEGNACSFALLEEARVKEAELFIAATGRDETNMIACAAAKHLGAGCTLARIQDPIYMSERDHLRQGFGIQALFNPDLETAREISRILRFPTAMRVETFAKGGAELVEYRVPERSPLEGLTLAQLPRRFHARVLVCAAERDGEICIPNGGYVLRGGDRLSISGDRAQLRNFFIAVHAYKQPVRNAMLLGGSRIAVYLARQLTEIGMRVVVIERDRARCERLCELLPRVSIRCGDGTRREVLEEEGIADMDAFVALTGYDEDNIILSMYANACQVDKVVTKVSDDHFSKMLTRSGLDCFVCPKLLAAEQIVQYVRAMDNAAGSVVETLYRLVDGKVEALQFPVEARSRCCGRPLRELRLRHDILIGAVIQGGVCRIPAGDTVMRAGDRSVVVTTHSGLRNLDAILEPEA